jgi:hypothetical protein
VTTPADVDLTGLLESGTGEVGQARAADAGAGSVELLITGQERAVAADPPAPHAHRPVGAPEQSFWRRCQPKVRHLPVRA